MKTVKEVSKCTGVSVRALHHYDAVSLLKPTQVTDAGYRLYDDNALERLHMILVYRELGLSLKQIRNILDAPDYDRNRVLEHQITDHQCLPRHQDSPDQPNQLCGSSGKAPHRGGRTAIPGGFVPAVPALKEAH